MSLTISHISKKYGDFTALDDFSFELKEPGVYALLGTNGAGKTTSIRIILGMLGKNTGEVLWKGKPFVATKERVGYLAEERGLYPKTKIIEQLTYFGTLKGMSKSESGKAIDYWFNRLEINEYKNQKPEQLSKGNQQKVQLAAALISDPELLILDEPLSGLDPINSDLFKSVINEQISKNKYIIMSSHQMPIIEEFCSEISILHHGKAVLQGNLNEIKKSYGRVNLSVKCDGDVLPLSEKVGLIPLKVTPDGIEFKISSEEQAHKLLNEMMTAGMPPIQYILREPSLHEIFVEYINKADENNETGEEK